MKDWRRALAREWLILVGCFAATLLLNTVLGAGLDEFFLAQLYVVVQGLRLTVWAITVLTGRRWPWRP